MKEILCPRCKIPMILNIEKSASASGTLINYFYRCKNCGYRLDDATILMKKKGEGYELKIVEYVGKEVH